MQRIAAAILFSAALLALGRSAFAVDGESAGGDGVVGADSAVAGVATADPARPSYLDSGLYFRTALGYAQFWVHDTEYRSDGAERDLTALGGFGLALDFRLGAAVSRKLVVGGSLLSDAAEATERGETGESEGAFVLLSMLGPFVAFYPDPNESGLSLSATVGWSVATRPLVPESFLHGPSTSLGFAFETRGTPHFGVGFRGMLAPLLRGSAQRVHFEGRELEERAQGIAWSLDFLTSVRL